MSTLYVRKTGNDSNAGTSAGVALLTIQHAVNIASNNDTIYVGAGIYREKVDAYSINVTGITLIGDIDGSHTGDSGEIILTGWDTDVGFTSLSGDTLHYGSDWTIKNLIIEAAGTSRVNNVFAVRIQADSQTSGLIQNCVLVAHEDNPPLFIDNTFTATPLHQVIENSVIWSLGIGCTILADGANIDLDVIFRNCLIVAQGGGGTSDSCISITGTGTSPGGVLAHNCTFVHAGAPVMKTSGTSTVVPCAVYNSLTIGCPISASGQTFKAGAAGQIVEDYNLLLGRFGKTAANAFYSNTTAGTHTISDGTYNTRMILGQDWLFGMRPKLFLSPGQSSTLLAWGSDSSVSLTKDFQGKQRPAGGKSNLKAVGFSERHNTWVKETSTVRTGSNSISILGPGDQDFDVAVDTISTTLSVYMRYDSNYTGTKPQFSVVNGTECGVADATATMTGAANTWEQLSLTFSPTAKGIVTLRLISNDTSGIGKAFADDRGVN